MQELFEGGFKFFQLKRVLACGVQGKYSICVCTVVNSEGSKRQVCRHGGAYRDVMEAHVLSIAVHQWLLSCWHQREIYTLLQFSTAGVTCPSPPTQGIEGMVD